MQATYVVSEIGPNHVTVADRHGQTVATLKGGDAWTRALNLAAALHNAYCAGMLDQQKEEVLKCYKNN